MISLKFTLIQEEAMLELAAKLAEHCQPPLVIFLYGQLGVGKTTFVRGFLRGLGYKGKVKSPSYNLVESYEIGEKTIFHFDFYRIQDSHELDFMGIRDYWQPRAIFLTEWPEKAAHGLPSLDLACHFELSDPGRKLCLEPKTPAGEAILSKMIYSKS